MLFMVKYGQIRVITFFFVDASCVIETTVNSDPSAFATFEVMSMETLNDVAAEIAFNSVYFHSCFPF